MAFTHLNYVRVERLKPEEVQQFNWYSVYCMDIGGIVMEKFTLSLLESQKSHG